MRQGFGFLKAAALNLRQARVYVGNLKGFMDSDFTKKLADSALDRKF
jgi:hypothetical protein